MSDLYDIANGQRAANGENAIQMNNKNEPPVRRINGADIDKRWKDIRENDRLIDAWCKKEGLIRSEISVPEKLKFIKLAKKAGL